MTIEIMDLLMNSMVIFHSYVNVYQAGLPVILVVWYTYPSEEYEFVSWDDSNIWTHGKIKFMCIHLLVNPTI